jgi:asparagine synthase (glutamine-hydrolysing)
MCGITGFFDMTGAGRPSDRSVLSRMTQQIAHRGPDGSGCHVGDGIAFGFRRLAILDLESGQQPMYNEDRSVVCICNGEIYNHRQLRGELEAKGHALHTRCDVEVLPHLYEEYGIGLLSRLNGQFALALFDVRERRLYLARDNFGVNPLFWTETGGSLVFGSEIKAVLEHPGVERAVDLTGLDQVLTFPGLVSPVTMFKGIRSIPGGHYVTARQGGSTASNEYWDLQYPPDGEWDTAPEKQHVEFLRESLFASVTRRLQADVPLGMYLSGGLDSSLVSAIVRDVSPDVERHTFSVSFRDDEMCEGRHQKRMARLLGSRHHDVPFGVQEALDRLETMVFHAECPVKETYDTACLALSEHAREHGVSVILTGQGADELFAGYIGYRFDQFHSCRERVEDNGERAIRQQMWGDEHLVYDGQYAKLENLKSGLYSRSMNAQRQEFSSIARLPIRSEKLRGRHPMHQRSYLDFKLRLADHLLADHGDRMAMANGVETRHPFLDLDVVDVASRIPPELMLREYDEKYVVKRVADGMVPPEILRREKFGWYAPGSPALVRSDDQRVVDLLSHDRIKRQGYFDPDAVDRLKREYLDEDFCLNQPFDTDLLTFVMTFSLFLDVFQLPALN